MGPNYAAQGETLKQECETKCEFCLLFSVTSRKTSAGSKMVANSKDEENRGQTNENGKTAFSVLFY